MIDFIRWATRPPTAYYVYVAIVLGIFVVTLSVGKYKAAYQPPVAASR